MSHPLLNWRADLADIWIMFNNPSIEAWKAVFSPKTKSLPSSADTWLSQLIVNAFPSRIRAEKVVESFREDNLLKESLFIVTFGAVGILESEPTLLLTFSQRR